MADVGYVPEHHGIIDHQSGWYQLSIVATGILASLIRFPDFITFYLERPHRAPKSVATLPALAARSTLCCGFDVELLCNHTNSADALHDHELHAPLDPDGIVCGDSS